MRSNCNQAIRTQIAHCLCKDRQLVLPCDDGIRHCCTQHLRRSPSRAWQNCCTNCVKGVLEIKRAAVRKITRQEHRACTVYPVCGKQICRGLYLPCHIALRIAVNPARLPPIVQNTHAQNGRERQRKHEKRGIRPLFRCILPKRQMSQIRKRCDGRGTNARTRKRGAVELRLFLRPFQLALEQREPLFLGECSPAHDSSGR